MDNLTPEKEQFLAELHRLCMAWKEKGVPNSEEVAIQGLHHMQREDMEAAQVWMRILYPNGAPRT